ncbi:putative rhamnosyltransferase [Lacticaseibacillus paracasei subsp. paracasei Lpp221]|uniref:glycosyltransferase n=1 Tax=Lacticaseibacillus paracasei TaxID=1597 RepID=UPI000343F306|nr:glycosyltransferase [Lacticaseibacillus paracasei]EPC80441.1 putative rhamnosyltransferase [Lacticaseibacillus paracasei subsp. paracasei Lpp221]
MEINSYVMRVAVLISTYNGSRFLDAQLQSIFAQVNVPVNVEVDVYVRDDGSCDSTLDVLSNYLTHPNFHIINSGGIQLGYAKSFMELLKYSSDGDLYLFSDQDDLWGEHKLSVLIEEFFNHDSDKPLLEYTDMVHFGQSNSQHLTEHGNDPALFTDFHKTLFEPRLSGNSIAINEKLRKILVHLWFDEGLGSQLQAHDTFVSRVAAIFGTISFVSVRNPETVMKYRIQGQNTSAVQQNKFRNKMSYLNNRIRVYDSRFDFVSLILNCDILNDIPEFKRSFLREMARLYKLRGLPRLIYGLRFLKFQKNALYKLIFFLWLL